MKTLIRTAALAGLVALMGACMTPGKPARTGSTYSCSNGTQLRVTYLHNGALVSVDGRRAVPFKQAPSNSGAVYENGGMRLARNGNSVTWNTAAKSASETCRAINTIN